ncbi:hypothetical protein NP493_396g01015 [Ridgeia piscesae]|uniref:V-type proton ATPase subunit a n=1 Tax=Ridgeia piscesae TaxID=27915 RepID=A0AAD9NUU2_RIDPI|nr:hypothetical protein NP493_396g01015 [Ridgeia piscesae]
MGLFRSEEMALCQLFLQSEAAYACISELGELGLAQFRDLNPDVNAFQRKFVNEVRRCDEMERKLRFLEKEIKKDEIPMLDTGDNPDAPAPREMIDLEATFEKLENEMKEVNANAEALMRNFLELTELKHILRKTQSFFEEAEHGYDHQALSDPGMADEHLGLLGEEGLRAAGQALRLGFVAGVIHRERLPAFERMLWRACHGNVFLKQAEIDTPLEDPVTGTQVNKTVFIIFFQGDQLKSRVQKICEGFRATLYPCPETPAERREMAIGVMTRIEDLNTVLGQTQDHRHRVLVAAAKNIKVWYIKVCKIKAIYHTLNMFNLDVTQKCLIGECWCSVADLDRVQQALRRATEHSGSSVPSILNRMATKKRPPTFNRTNRFTSVFQGIVDAYGVATYQEVNPAPYTIISFPFLFSLMFGDTGHGTIMFLFALWMVIKEKKLLAAKSDNEIWNMFFGGRYIILLMGAFSIHAGILYNDIFAKSMNIFGSAWYPNMTLYSPEHIGGHKEATLDPRDAYDNNTYPFGMDPVWQLAKNKIPFLNSFKMKLSVIIGISQMLFGVILSAMNHRFFKDRISFFFEFIPQVVFLLSIFGYLIGLIVFKWIAFDASKSGIAPSLLIHLINMFLMSYPTEPESATTFYSGQKFVQLILLAVAVICIPWMLVMKPVLLKMKHAKEGTGTISAQHTTVTTEDGQVVEQGQGDHPVPPPPQTHAEDDEKFSFGEAMVHQSIHTIEYCLGCVSHTASYLRLWALSLAHAELSEVLWNMVFAIGLKQNGILGAVLIFMVFTPWAALTVTILLLMEGLSAFLHTLRLHW